MKKILWLILVLNFLFVITVDGQSNGNSNTFIGYKAIPHYGNICIGRHAGQLLTDEDLCIIVGHDSAAVNSIGKDMVWQVDWNEPALSKKLKYALKDYYTKYIITGKDNRKNRIAFIRDNLRN